MNFIKLDDGRYLYNDHGKYRPNLTFLLEEIPTIKIGTIQKESIDGLAWANAHANDFNMEGRDLRALQGKFWTSRKGTNCFTPDPNGSFLLLKESWGGNRDRGDLGRVEGALYYRRASSNGGGNGYTYMVLPCGYKASVSIDEI